MINLAESFALSNPSERDAARGKVNDHQATYASLMRAIEKLDKNLVYDRNEECTLLPDGRSVGICTNSALYLKSILGGVVVGYDHSENPTAEIGVRESGHDFLLLEQFIVDFWAAKIYGTPPVVRRSRTKLLRRLYGDPSHWHIWTRGPLKPGFGLSGDVHTSQTRLDGQTRLSPCLGD